MKIHIYTNNRHIGMGVLSYIARDGHFRLKISSDSHNLSEVVSESQIRTLESEYERLHCHLRAAERQGTRALYKA